MTGAEVSHFRGMRHLCSELDYRDAELPERWDVWGTPEILTEHRSKISIGSPGDSIDALSGGYRQLIEATEYHATGRILLKKKEPEEELDEAIDMALLPPDLRRVMEIFDIFEADASGLREQILLINAKQFGNHKVLQWVADNFDLFITESPEDAITRAETIEKLPSPPRDRYKVVERFTPNRYKEASERRISHLKSTLADIDELYTIPEIERFLGRIRDSYREDLHIIAQWTEEEKQKDKKMYLDSLRRRGLDQEAIRRKMWGCFDRLPEEERKVVSQARPLRKDWIRRRQTGGEIEQNRPPLPISISTRRQGQCIWETEKSKAFCELTQTKRQWRKIYAYLWKKMEDAIGRLATEASNTRQRNKVRQLMGRYQSRLTRKGRDRIIKLLREEES